MDGCRWVGGLVDGWRWVGGLVDGYRWMGVWVDGWCKEYLKIDDDTSYCHSLKLIATNAACTSGVFLNANVRDIVLADVQSACLELHALLYIHKLWG